jgi:hypothetical protein
MLKTINPSTYEHTCNRCGHEHEAGHGSARHAMLGQSHALAIDCPNCGTSEHFNMDLTAEHETHPDLTDEHRHQARQIRLLMKHRGIPLPEERVPPG